MNESVRVLVVDDEEIVRESLTGWLRKDGYTVQSAHDGRAALDAVAANRFSIVLLDLKMPGMDGLAVIREAKRYKADLPVIIITGHGDVSLAVEAMKLGAVDFLEKPFDDDLLLAAVRAALNRDSDAGKRKAELAGIQEKLAELSNRERQVLEGLVAGKANKVIAFDLDISPRTVEIYRANLMTKMAANSLSDLVRMAIVTGILDSTGKSGR